MHLFQKSLFIVAALLGRILWSPFKAYEQFIRSHRRGVFAGSTQVSIFLRPLLERDFVKKLIGAPILAALVMTGVNTPSDLNQNSFGSWKLGEPLQEVLEVNLTTNVVENAIPYNLPTSNLLGISQFYGSGHPGIDLRSPVGAPVVSLKSGKVALVKNDTLGYGKHLFIDHGDGITSLYAHLSKIDVTEGQKVDGGTTVGAVGMTGWTTGPHVHFEVRKNGLQINPMPYLQIPIKVYNEQFLNTNESSTVAAR